MLTEITSLLRIIGAINMRLISLFKAFFLILLLLTIPSIGLSSEHASDGYFWEKLTKNEKMVYALAYVAGFNKMNQHVREMLDVAIGLEKADVVEYAKTMKKYYKDNFRYYGITLIQLVDGIDNLYSDYKNKTIRLSDAFHLVQTEIKGVDEKKIEEMKQFMRKSEKDQIKEIMKKFEKRSQESKRAK